MIMLKSQKLNIALIVLSFVLPLVVFSLTAWQTHGWDDEFITIGHLNENNTLPFWKCIFRVNEYSDTQPVGMYVFDLFFYKLFNSWSAVRVAGALFVALSLWTLWFKTRKNEDFFAELLYYVLICLNPSILLWCSGIRWYTWILPFVCFLGILMNKCNGKFSRAGTIKFWMIYFILSVLMFHVSYFSAVIILASFLCICHERRKFLISELKIIMPLGLASIILISWQSYYFLTVHYPTGKNAMGMSMLKCLVFAGQYFLSGAALVPVSIFAIFSITAGVILFISFLINFRTVIKGCSSKFIILTCLMNVLLKIAVAARYYVIIAPQYAVLMRDSLSLIRNKLLKSCVVILYCLSSIGGIYAVMTHSDTLKASWNTPYAEIIYEISNINATKKIPVATANTVLSWHLEKLGFRAIDLHFGEDININNWIEPVIIVKTYKGTLSDECYAELNKFIEKHDIKMKTEIGKDGFAWFKRKFDNDYPDYYAEIFLIE